ncbi:MAG: hypothetical protein Q7T80_06855 [Methanoregula sp.]|nr:hypothetical protein [Methanoregula sp.]
MKFLAKFFFKSPEKLLAKGDHYLDSGEFFDAKRYYEDGLKCCTDDESVNGLKATFTLRIAVAKQKIAELNFHEAEFALSSGYFDRAVEHLHLVKALAHDEVLLKKADKMLCECVKKPIESSKHASLSAGLFCSSTDVENTLETQELDGSLPTMEYFDLLIQQLPKEQYIRYSQLGEDFASAYVVASLNKHEEALSLLDSWHDDSCRDIYFCERGKLLHRLGHDEEAEQHFLLALQMDRTNVIALYNLALFLVEKNRIVEAVHMLETMESDGLMTEQALLLRAEVIKTVGNLDSAINLYSQLLTSQLSRTAAEKLYGVLHEAKRHSDAEIVFKRYLSKYCRSTLAK